MLSYTPENILILAVFQLLIAGLILCSGGALLYLKAEPQVRNVLKLVTVAFAFYALHFLLHAAIAYGALSPSGPGESPRAGEFLSQGVEKAALTLLGFSYLNSGLRISLAQGFWWKAVGVWILLVGAPYLAESYGPGAYPHLQLSFLLNGVWLAGVTTSHLWRIRRRGLLSGSALAILSVAQFLRALSEGSTEAAWWWSLESGAILVGLGLFAVVVDTRTAVLPVRFFLRLNLIFIALASMLILADAEVQRREHLRIAENQTLELSEFLRSHVIQFRDHAQEPREILSSREISRKIISEFGRLPDLRRVRIFYAGWRMEMTIADNWVVTHEILPEDRHPDASRWVNEWGQAATLTPVPIISRGNRLGHIEMDESLRTINEQVARHMRLIFLTFTAAVFIAAALFGFTVRDAYKTIQQQFEELKKTHARLAHVDRLASVGELAGGVAHEINNPTGIIITTADYVLRQAEKQSLSTEFREDLQTIRRQARRVSDIVNGLLAFSRPAILHKRPVSINDVLRQSLTFLAARFREQQLRVELNLGPALPPISVDSDRLEQVFVNLLNNAADAMPQGGGVILETSSLLIRGVSYQLVMVADSGHGIAEEDMKNIFDPFFSTKPPGKGTGLGLSVSHGIIRDHGGWIDVESRVGKGTVFRVYLKGGEVPGEEI